MEENTRALKTALFGFNREQVLACIDDQMKKNLELERQYQAQLSAMREEKAKLAKEKDELSETAQALRNDLKDKTEQTQALQSELEDLSASLRKSQADANDLKHRLFQREQEFLGLKKTRYALEEENKALQEKLTAAEEQCAGLQSHAMELEQQSQSLAAEAQAKIDSLTRESQLSRREADEAREALTGLKADYSRQLDELNAAHAGDLAAARELSENRAETAERRAEQAEQQLSGLRQEMEIRLQEAHHQAFEKTARQSAQLRRDAKALDDGITSLRDRLNAVDQHILQAASDLQAATAAINAVLDSAELQARQLEGQLNRLAAMQAPERTAAKPAPEPAAAPAASTRPARPQQHTARTAGSIYAKNLLEKLNRLIGE